MPTDIAQDLHDARSLLEQSGTQDEKRKFRKAAEIILLKALHLEPENKEAKALLQSARAESALARISPSETTQHETTAPTGTILFKDLQPKQKKKWSLKLPLGLLAVVLVAGGLMRMLPARANNPVRVTAPVQGNERASNVSFQSPVEPIPSSNSEPAALPATSPEVPKPTVDINPVRNPIANPSPNPTANAAPKSVPNSAPVMPTKATTPAVAPAAPRSAPTALTGTLAVSSPTGADIYQKGQLIGSTPATLQLPAGPQTLEYRHGELRTTVIHEIKANETTAASVTFQITVQINAKPWAQVSLEGTPRHPLGQTPLSGVSVPIGGTLIFENPNFTAKTYRITEKDTAIQLNFP